MLLSMTGFGEARQQQSGLSVAIELRTINSRYFKIALRTGEGYAALEPQIEAAVRNHIKRGTVQVNLRISRPASPDAYHINTDVLTAYWRQLNALPVEWNLPRPNGLESLLVLPGVVSEEAFTTDSAEQVWPLVGATLEAALKNLARMREEEGRAMTADLRANLQAIGGELEQIAVRAPQMVEDFRARLAERLRKVLAEHDLALDPADVIREIAIFAERGDISEEIVRLRSHLEQFESIIGLAESSGRKLEFLTQEMHREINTRSARKAPTWKSPGM